MVERGLAYLRQFDRNLWILSLGWFVSAVGFAVSLPFIAIYFQNEFGISLTGVGVFFAGLAIIRSAVQAVAGELSDRLQRRHMAILTQCLRAVAFLGLAAAIYYHWGVWWCGFWLTVHSIFGSIFHPIANALVADILPQRQRLDGYAITRTAGNLGWATGPALGGYIATESYGVLFVVSAVFMLLSGLVFFGMKPIKQDTREIDRFRLRDLAAVKDDARLARHSILSFLLYLVVAQMIVPFSLYAVNLIGITKQQLGHLYTVNGLLVAFLQIPVTRAVSRFSLTRQLAVGGILYAVGYGMVGSVSEFWYLVVAFFVVTLGEIVMSPASVTLTSRLAPRGRMGRYMGIQGFFMAAGWSIGPLYGNVILDVAGESLALAWLVISSLAVVSAIGYAFFGRWLPPKYNQPQETT